MGEITIKVRCWVCSGDGIYKGDTCPTCAGLGKLDTPEGISTMDITEITDKLDSMVAELNYIHGKVTAIWNAVKPPK